MNGLVNRVLKLTEEYAVDPFAKKAQMYCQKRPKLNHLVKEFYRMYRALAERYDQKNDEEGDEALIRRIADLELELQETKQKLNGDNNSDLVHKVTVYERELKEAIEKISEMRAERDALREEAEKKEAKIKEMEKHMEALHLEQVRLRRRSSELSEEVEKQRVAVLEVAEQKKEVIRLLSVSLDYYKNRYERSMPNDGNTLLRILGIKY